MLPPARNPSRLTRFLRVVRGKPAYDPLREVDWKLVRLPTARFTPIGHYFPKEPKTKDDVLVNIEYMKNEIKRLKASWACVEDRSKVLSDIEDVLQFLWESAAIAVTEETASSVDLELRQFCWRIGRFACGSIYNPQVAAEILAEIMLALMDVSQAILTVTKNDKARLSLECNIFSYMCQLQVFKDTAAAKGKLTWTTEEAMAGLRRTFCLLEAMPESI